MDYSYLTKEIAKEITTLWNDPAIQVRIFMFNRRRTFYCLVVLQKLIVENYLQETYSHGNKLQVPDCAQYFMENLERFSEATYVPTKVVIRNLFLHVILLSFLKLCLPVTPPSFLYK